MISRVQIALLGVVYTTMIVLVVAVVTDPPAVTVIGVAVAWFSIGRAWERLPRGRQSKRPIRWGRQ